MNYYHYLNFTDYFVLCTVKQLTLTVKKIANQCLSFLFKDNNLLLKITQCLQI